MGAVCAARAAASSNGFISGQGVVVGSSNVTALAIGPGKSVVGPLAEF